MKLKNFFNFTALTMLLTLAACNGDSGSSSSTPAAQDAAAAVTADAPATEGTQATATVAKEDLREDEKADILFMFEEEKMARDVYKNMYEKYKKAIFSNIAKSEQQHMDSVKKLLDQAGLPAPVDPNKIGEFTNPVIIQLYAELMARGNKSLFDAYQVGLDIELIDIKDLSERIPLITDPAIKQVFENLLKASYNHKEAFEAKL